MTSLAIASKPLSKRSVLDSFKERNMTTFGAGSSGTSGTKSSRDRKRDPDIRSLRLSHKMLQAFAAMAAGGGPRTGVFKKVGLRRDSYYQALRLNPELQDLHRVVMWGREGENGSPRFNELVYTPERLDIVLARIREGRSIRDAIRDMPFSADGYKYRLGRFPAEKQRHIEAKAAAALRGVNVFAEVDKVLPRTMPDDMRMELMQTLCLQLLSGQITLKSLPKCLKAAKTEYWKGAPSKYGPVSLDAARFDDGDATLHDRVSEGLWTSEDDDDE